MKQPDSGGSDFPKFWGEAQQSEELVAVGDVFSADGGGALVEYVVALSFATMAAVVAMWAVGKPLMDHFFWAYSLLIQPM